MTATDNQWISFFERQPVDAQSIFYYGQHIGVWSGEYRYSPEDPVSHHIILCNESPGIVDRMDAPWWMEDYGQDKPQKPSRPVPPDYPSG